MGTLFDDYFSCGELQTSDHRVWHLFRMNLEGIDDDSNLTEDLINMKTTVESKWKFPMVAWSTFGLLNWKHILYRQKMLSLCWCLSRKLTCAKQDFPTSFTSNQKLEIDCILSTTCE